MRSQCTESVFIWRYVCRTSGMWILLLKLRWETKPSGNRTVYGAASGIDGEYQPRPVI